MTIHQRRLIEAGFPCHQVGAETRRERDTGQQPPTARLHVWWARRPLTASRAAILASLQPDTANIDRFLMDLGIETKVVDIGGSEWALTGDLLDMIRSNEKGEYLTVDKKVLSRFEKEAARRSSKVTMTEKLFQDNRTKDIAELRTWAESVKPFEAPLPLMGERMTVRTRPADSALGGRLLDLVKTGPVRSVLGKEFRLDPTDLYAYDRAFKANPTLSADPKVVLDVTSGGGSIPFEAMRLGHTVVANELNPVATTILRATLDYPVRFGSGIVTDLARYGKRVVEAVSAGTEPFYTPDIDLGSGSFDRTNSYIFAREVTCPHCGGDAPLLNTHWLAKDDGDPWAVHMRTDKGKVAFECYRVGSSDSPHGADPDLRTVTDGVGACIHPNCRQAIAADEIKRQARGESKHGSMRDRLYAVVGARIEPALKDGVPVVVKSGMKAGQTKTKKVSYYRSPNAGDLAALARAQAYYDTNFEAWEQDDLIPTEALPEGAKTPEPLRFGMLRWCDLFTPRQLISHVTMAKTIIDLREEMTADLGRERADAVMTLLQMAADKCLDYNSKQTRWHSSRGTMVGTFGRHDFSVKWTFGEIPMSGPATAQAWGISQIVDAMAGLCDLTSEVRKEYEATGRGLPKIVNGSASEMTSSVDTASVDAIVFDPPYYDKVQYAELSDYFYVWQKRVLKDAQPDLFRRRLTDKTSEAVANPVRDDGAKNAKASYEHMMGQIFAECRRVLKDDGIMTMMFTHKDRSAWETLTRSLIESGFVIAASVPVESEAGDSMHQKDQASASTTVFIACRKRLQENTETGQWVGIGGTGVKTRIRQAVTEAIVEFEHLKLSPIDEMIACYGRALQVLSERWPVFDGDEIVTPSVAMAEASAVVAGRGITKMTGGRFTIDDFDAETAFAMTVFGIGGFGDMRFDDAASLSRATGISLVDRSGGYVVSDGQIGLAPSKKGIAPAAPLRKNGSKVTLLAPSERDPRRFDKPQSAWDRASGALAAYLDGDEVSARSYIERTGGTSESLRAVLDVIAGSETEKWSEAAKAVNFALRTAKAA